MPHHFHQQASKSKSPNIQQRSKRFKKEKSSLTKFVSKGGYLHSSIKEKSFTKKVLLKLSKIPTLKITKKENKLKGTLQNQNKEKSDVQNATTDLGKKNSLKYPKDYVYEISNMEGKRKGGFNLSLTKSKTIIDQIVCHGNKS